MKKILVLLSVMLLSFTFVACGTKSTDDAKVPETAPVAEAAATPAPTPAPAVTEAPTVAQTEPAKTNETYEAPVAKETEAAGEALKIVDIKTTTQEITDDGAGVCYFTMLWPVVGGIKEEEVNTINDCLDTDVSRIEEEILEMIDTYEDAPKSAGIEKVEMTALGKQKAVITFTGKLVPFSGSAKNIKYTFTYNRNEGTSELSK